MKTYLNKKTVFFYISVFTILIVSLLITSCASEKDIYNNSSSSEEVSAFLSSDESEEITSESPESLESQEDNNYDDNYIKNLLINTYKDEKICFKTDISFSYNDFIYSLNSKYSISENYTMFSNIFKASIVSDSLLDEIENNQTQENTAYFLDNKCYFTDYDIGKSSYKSTIDEFKNTFKDDFFYFDILSFSDSFVLTKDNTYQYTFTDEILNTDLFKELFSMIEYDEISFSEGKFYLTVENDAIKISAGFLKVILVSKGEASEIKMDLVITENAPKQEIELNPDEYKNFESKKDYLFSKSLFNLVSNQTVEYSSNVRIYDNLDENSFIDMFSLTSFNNNKNNQQLYYELNLDETKKTKYQRYIFDNKFYEKLVTDKKVISNEDSIYNNMFKENKCMLWGILPFDILSLDEFEITEDDTYYIIDYSYLSEYSIEVYEGFLSLYNKCVGESFYIPCDFEFKNISSNGRAIIRKSDNILVEQSCEIILQTEKSVKTKLIISSEVLSIDEEINIPKP